jgi:hypothetical protein
MRALGILGAIAALLAAYLVFFDHDPRDAGAAAVRLVPAFDRAAVRRIAVARASGPAYELVRAGGDWRIQPGDGPADRGAVEDLLAAVDQAESQRTADLSPREAGLAPPRVTLALTGDRQRAELRLGKPDASGRGVFVQRGTSGPVLVGPRRLLQLADRPAGDLRDRRLVPFAPEAVTHVEWRTAPDDRGHGWDRAGDVWRNAAGERLAPERAEAALRMLAGLRSSPPSGPAAGAGQGWIELRGPGGATVHLTPAELPAETMSELWRALDAADAPDRRLLSTPPERVRRVELADGGRRLVLSRAADGGAWRFEAPDPRAWADAQVVDAWLARLAHTEVTAPARTGRRLIVDGDAAGAVTVGPRDPAYALLSPDPLRFRSRQVLDFAHFDVRELKRAGGGVAYDARSPDGERWTSARPGQAIDPAATGRVVAALGNLRAERFEPRPPAGAPSVVLEVEVQPPGAPAPERHELELWSGCAARTEDGSVFQIAPPACAELRLDPTAAAR